MTISERITDIIDRRKGRGAFEGKGHLEVVNKKIEFFDKLKEVLERHETFRSAALSQIESKNGDYFTLSLEDPTFEQKLSSASSENLKEKIDAALKKLNELHVRFDRDTINISVVGRAGQGKSRLLQSISGVDNAIIPADSGGDCTGAKSVICNSPGPLHAIIHCYSEAELLEQVQKYLDELNYGRKLGSVSQIPNIDLKTLGAQEMTNRQESYYDRICTYVNKYSVYSELLGTDKPIDNKDEIRKYVAQYLLDGTPVFHFLAVKEVQIFTPFNYADAGQIMLVDTIGLGDTSIGLRDKMIDTLVNDSDAAILLRRPDPERDGIREEDNDLYDMINARTKGRDLSKWLFYVLNIYANNEKSGNKLYDQLTRKLGKTLKAAFLEKIDCANKEDVEAKLIIPMLNLLSTNLTSVDNSLMASANELLAECHADFYTLCNKVQSLSESNFKKDLNTGGLFDKLYEDELGLARMLEEYNMKYKNHDMICEEIDVQVKKSIAKIVSVCPQHETIISALKSGKLGAHPSIVYENMSDHYRADVSDIFDEINRSTIVNLQEGLKNDLINILKSSDGGMLDAIPVNTDTDTPTETEWMSAFISQRLSDFPLVQAAFENVLNYRLNIEGMLEYYVNMSLEYLDPEEKKKFASIDFQDAENKEEEADLIEQGLLAAARLSANTLIDLIKDLLKIPYNSFYARTRKLREAIIYSKEGERELKNMYREYATYIWRDRFAAVATKQVAMKELNDIIDSMSQYRTKNLFILNIAN